jgi:phosphatidate cytidylyltransferase
MKRLTTGLIIALCWLALLVSHSFALIWLVAVIISGLALHEYFTICLHADEMRIKPMAIAIGAIPLIAALSGRTDLVLAAFFIALLASALLLFASYQGLENGFLLLAKVCAGLAFVSLSGAHLPLLMAAPHGVAWLVILTLITIGSDTGAFYAGTTFGKTKLCPAISPGKTVEGLLGGMTASLILAVVAGLLLLPGVPILKMAVIAILVTLIGVVGDLTESVLKRSCQVKDSGTILPGHGGVLDRIDSLLAAAPAIYYLSRFDLL